MTSAAIAATDRTELQQSQAGFGQLLHAEWTKFRTVRGWVIAMMIATAVIVGLGLFPGVQGSCGQHGPESACVVPVGPGGEEVTDGFYFVHQSLAGDGSITVRVNSLTGQRLTSPTQSRPGLVPWAKAGLIIKASTRPGSAYAAVMVTGSHGVRMQYNYTHDIAGQPGNVSPPSPRWLRLTRTGDTITGAESADGIHWTTLARAHLAELPSTVQAGLLTASPQYTKAIGAAGAEGGPTRATAGFDHLDRQGSWPSRAWTGGDVGTPDQSGQFEPTGAGFTVTGSGDIAPAVPGAAGLGVTVSQTLIGTFIGLIMVVAVGAMFITTEYRRGLIRTTLAAYPRRGPVLAAKAIVVGALSFVIGLAAAAIVVTLGPPILRSHGAYVHPATTLTEVRLVVGTAALLAVAAVLALSIGALLRRSALAITAVIVVIVLPYLLAISVLPAGVTQWLLRVSPAAAFAVQQSAPRYAQVDNIYLPANGYFPLAPWAGFAVLCLWTAFALGLARYRLNRRDA